MKNMEDLFRMALGIEAPWAGKLNGFTLLFEALILQFARCMPVKKGCGAEQIINVCSDMSPSFISGASKYLPEASHTFDRFHVMKVINDAVDRVRKWERNRTPALRNMRYVLLKNRENLSKQDMERVKKLELESIHLKTVEAYHMRENFQFCYQAAKAKARGYSTKKNLINIAYLILGKFDFSRINRFCQSTHF